MVRPMLFVGLGDSGCQTLGALELTLNRRLEQINWTEGPPAAWRFVHVDLVPRVERPAVTTTSHADYISLLQPGETYNDAYAVIDGLFDSEETKTRALAGWMRPPLPVRVLIQQTQSRALGRSAIASRLGELRQQLIPHIAALRDGGNVAQLQSLARRLGIGDSTYDESPNPVVTYFGSLAGSTGSAILLDVAAVMTSIDPTATWLHEQVAFLYTPDIFDSLHEGARSQIPMNTLGAIGEISSGLWADEMSPATQALFNASGIRIPQPQAKPAFGLARTYLVGANRASRVDTRYGASTPSTSDAFSSFGESIAGLLTHAELDFLGAFSGNNLQTSGTSQAPPENHVTHRLADAIDELPFSTVDIGRISTGMGHLLDYASEGLARNHIELLLFPRFEAEVQSGFESEQACISRSVAEHQDIFAAGCKLLDASSHLHAERLTSLDRDALGIEAPKLTLEIRRHLVDYTARWVSRVGLQVTADLLRFLRDQVQRAASQESQRSDSKQRSFSPKYSLTTDTEMVLDSLVEICDIAAVCLGDEVDTSIGSASARDFARLPDLSADRSASAVSPHKRPRESDLTLINPDSFPHEFEQLMIQDLPAEKKNRWESLTLTLSLQGLPLRWMDPKSNIEVEQSLIEVSTPAIPEGDLDPGKQTLKLRMPTTVQEIVLRNRAWLQDIQSSFGRRCLMGIAEYCTHVDERVQAERQGRFLQYFADILQRSDSLIDSRLVVPESAHGNPNPSARRSGSGLTISEIPFARDSTIGRQCVEILARAGLNPDLCTFESSSMKTDVLAVATVTSGMHAPVFDSLVDSFWKAWLRDSAQPATRHTFWEGRRSRPLSEALPLRPEVRLSMIIGWFVSFMFGQRKIRTRDPIIGHTWEIWDPQTQWVDFPFPMLRYTTRGDSDLPAILESVSLAMIQASHEASERPLIPYARLDQVGREITTAPHAAPHLAGPDPTASDLIRTWVATGTVSASGAPSLFPLAADNSGRSLATPQERLVVIRQRVQALRDQYQALLADFAGMRWQEVPGIFEMKDHVVKALDLFMQYCETLNLADGPSPGSN